MEKINKGTPQVKLFPPLWEGDDAVVEVVAYGLSVAARCKYVNGRPALRPWPDGQPSHLFRNQRITDAVHLAFRRLGGGQ